MNTYGNGRPAPPAMAREAVELQRVAGRIANTIRHRADGDYWINIEADVSPTLLRLVFHYRAGSSRPRADNEARTVELNLIAGHPIDDSAWVASVIDDVWRDICQGESDLIVPHVLDFVRYVAEDGGTIFHDGNALEFARAK